MDKIEFDAWQAHMKKARGFWRIDEIHNGENGKDFLTYQPSRDDETKGVFVQVNGADATAGRFSDAYPNIGEAALETVWTKTFSDHNDAMTRMIERLGVGFLLNAVCGADVYR